MHDVVVIGAGVSGLTCAWQLKREGLDVLVLESGPRPGGVIESHHVDDCLIESGPNTILPTPGAMDLIRDAGLESEVVRAPTKSPRFIYLNGRLRKVPWVLSPSGWIRVLAEPLVRRRRAGEEESIRSFFTRRFGGQAHDRLVAPFVSGIYAGDTGKLSLEGSFPRLAELECRYGSVVLGMLLSRRSGSRRAGLSSFRTGMRALPEALAADLNVRYRVKSIEIADEFLTVDGREVRYRALALATPAYAGAELLRARHEGLSALLGSIEYAPLIVAASVVEEARLPRPLRGFGFLVPRNQGVRMLGTLFSSVLFPGRSPRGKQLLTSFLGGATDRDAVEWSDGRVWETVQSELASILELTGAVDPVRLFRYGRAIPQYRIGHLEWREKVRACLASSPGLFLTGNYLNGVAVPAAMEHAKETAEEIVDYVRR